MELLTCYNTAAASVPTPGDPVPEEALKQILQAGPDFGQQPFSVSLGVYRGPG